MSRKIDIICFTGTGNTKRVVEKIVGVLSENDVEVRYFSPSDPYVHRKGNELLLAFPANTQCVSPYIWKYMKALPEGEGDKVYAVLTLNQSASILMQLQKLLQKKGYLPQGSIEISMPNNLLMGPDDTGERMPQALLDAEKFAQAIIENKVAWEERMKGSSFVSFLARDTNLPWVTMRLVNKLEINPEKCIKCGLCVKECPVQNIRMDEFPVHGKKCEFCMHCAAACPSDAVRMKGRPQCHIRRDE